MRSRPRTVMRSAAPGSGADEMHGHGLVHIHCVTGMPARQPVFSPTGAGARHRDADQFAAQRGVAGEQQRLGLQRHGIDHEPAAGPQRARRGIEHRGIARRRRQKRRRASAGPTARPALRLRTISEPGTPNAAALRRMRAARSARRSIAIARIAGSASIHSIATEPEPAPMSQSSSPRRGASDDSVTARISRLVIWPSCSNRSSARPDVQRHARARPAPPHFDGDEC